MGNTPRDNIVSTDTIRTGGLPDPLELFEGAEVMLRSNININKGLVNGARGFVEINWSLFCLVPKYASGEISHGTIEMNVTLILINSSQNVG